MATYGFDENKNKIEVLPKTETGTLSSLRTTDKSSLVAAVNECFQNASDGKSKLAAAIGNGATASMTWDQLQSKVIKTHVTDLTNITPNAINGNQRKWIIPREYKNLPIYGLYVEQGDRSIQGNIKIVKYIFMDVRDPNNNIQMYMSPKQANFVGEPLEIDSTSILVSKNNLEILAGFSTLGYINRCKVVQMGYD